MQINNLEINILYFICNAQSAQKRDGKVRYEDVFREFSDIPGHHVTAAVESMIADRTIAMDASQTQMTITDNGIRRLQASIACKIHHFDSCRCGPAPNEGPRRSTP